MNFKTNVWHARLYRATHYKNPPTDGCSYFWSVVLLVMAWPFTWWTYFVEKDDTFWPRIKLGVAGYCILIFLSTIGAAFSKEALHQGGIWQLIWGIPCAIGFVAVIAGLLYVGCFIAETYQKAREKAEKVQSVNLAVEAFKAWRGRYCPQITWIEAPERQEDKDSQ